MNVGGATPAGMSQRTADMNPLSTALGPVEYGRTAGWTGDDHAAAFACFLHSCRRMAARPHKTKALGIDAGALARIAACALSEREAAGDSAAAKAFFESHFRPCRFAQPSPAGFVTGYYEPVVAASRVRTSRFAYPLYRRPHDLVEVDDASRPAGTDAAFRFARQTDYGLVEYHDRSQIEAGALAGRGLELAWIESPVDGFFIHIQGSARLAMPDGSTLRISYDAKSGHPFTPVGAVLIESGELRREAVTMASIRAWMVQNEDRAAELMARNRSFIFFRESGAADDSPGPIAAASVPLSPGRSLAADHRLHTFGTPVFVTSQTPIAGLGKRLRRLMIVQDTGSAIVGPQRGDLFIGTGEAAGEIAGAIRHAARFVVFVPRHQLAAAS